MSSFHLFPHLPTEIRLKIWSTYLSLTPPTIHPFSLTNSDLDYLSPNRASCHNHYHILAHKPSSIPSILHTCREAREVALGPNGYKLGFNDVSNSGNRILSRGREDTDVDMFTTCVHEAKINDEEGWERGTYFHPERDVVFFAANSNNNFLPTFRANTATAATANEDVSNPRQDLKTVGDLQLSKASYIWGGKTGIKIGRRVGRLAMSFQFLNEFQYRPENFGFEVIGKLYIFSEEWTTMRRSDGLSGRREDRGLATYNFRGENLDLGTYASRVLAFRGVFADDGGGLIPVEYGFRDLDEILEFVASEVS